MSVNYPVCMPRALVIRAAGTNCDAELCRAFTLAGAESELVHLDVLCAEPQRLDDVELIGFPGGFSYGDDVASGRVFAMKVRERLYPAMRAAIDRGALVFGVCNGFQVLVQVGLLPGPSKGKAWRADRAQPQTVALTDNKDARFHDRWVGVTFDPKSVCVWTRGIDASMNEAARRDVSQLPVAHGEGRFVPSSPAVLAELEQNGQVAIRYSDNYNGSAGAVAGICDVTGRVFGLMPHPERYLDWNRHPYWTRLDGGVRKGPTPGMQMFLNAVEAAKQSREPSNAG